MLISNSIINGIILIGAKDLGFESGNLPVSKMTKLRGLGFMFIKISEKVPGYYFLYTVEPVYIEHSREMKKCSMYAGVQCIQVLSIWMSGEM